MYQTLLPSLSPIEFVNRAVETGHALRHDALNAIPFDLDILSARTIYSTHHEMHVLDYLRCFRFTETMHLVSGLDGCDTISNKYIRPVIEMALNLFLLPNATLTVKDTSTGSGASGHFELVLSSPVKQQVIPLIFFMPGTIDTNEWIPDQKLDPNRSYPSLTIVLTTALQLAPHKCEKPYQIFVTDELHSMLLFITRMPTYTHLRAYICPEKLSLRACILSLVMDHACTMRARIGIHDHYNGIAGVPLEDPLKTLATLTPKCMLDFDMYSVQRDKTQTLWKVFLDWKEAGEREALQTHQLVVGHELGLPARSGSFLRRHIPYRSPFPQRRLSPPDLSLLTPFPRLKDPIAALLLHEGHDFIFHPEEAIKTGADNLKYSQTYFGHATVEGNSSGRLCIKLFDERLFSCARWDVENWLGRKVPLRLRTATFNVAEEMARREEAAYTALEYLQGTLLPYSYGFHYFLLPDGHECLGFVMEAVTGIHLDLDDALSPWSEERQIDFINLVRTAFRAIAYAGINQTDWHGGQILMLPNDTIVFIDFAFALQYPCLCHTPVRDDWFRLMLVLKHSGIREDLLDRYWVERDEFEY